MKKIFTLVAAVLVAGSMMAKQTTVDPGDKTLSTAIGAAAAGDTLVLSTGVYSDSVKLSIEKELTFMADADAKPVIDFKHSGENYRFKASLTLIGVEVVYNAGGYVIRTGSNIPHMIVKDCYFHGGAGPFLYASSNTIDKVVIDNCIFADDGYSEGGAFKSTTGKIKDLSITNCTFYNFSGKRAIQVQSCDTAVIDHCTFYNVGENPIYVGVTAITKGCIVKNSIIDSISAGTATTTYGGSVSYCMYNRAAAPFENKGAVAVSNCLAADPLFVDPANGDFNLQKTSPAIGAAEDGTNLGDPRWIVYDPTAIVNTKAEQSCKKVMVNGQMMIIKDGKAYNVLGF